VRMIGTMHEAIIVNTGQENRGTNMEIKKPYVDVQYSKFMKDVDGRPAPVFLRTE